jgi:hypothetical protein
MIHAPWRRRLGLLGRGGGIVLPTRLHPFQTGFVVSGFHSGRKRPAVAAPLEKDHDPGLPRCMAARSIVLGHSAARPEAF